MQLNAAHQRLWLAWNFGVGMKKNQNYRLNQLAFRNSLVRDFWIFFLVIGVGIISALNEIHTAVYRSPAQVFVEFMNGPDRVLFPVVVALIYGVTLSQEISNRFIANTRARQDVRNRLVALFIRATTRAFVGFAALVLSYWIVTLYVVPVLWPHAVDSSAYGLAASKIYYLDDVNQSPLSANLKFGWGIFCLTSFAWISVCIVAFGAITFISVIFIHKTVLALVVPMIFYIAESLAFELVGMPIYSFLISGIYPAGLQHLDLHQAIAPALGTLLIAIVSLAVVIAKSPKNPRFS